MKLSVSALYAEIPPLSKGVKGMKDSMDGGE
jgi:hypothetical protein